MIEAVRDPGEEGVHLEEDTTLRELVELRVAVQEAGGDKLIKDAEDERWEDCKEDIVEREGPGLGNDLAREGVLERVLQRVR